MKHSQHVLLPVTVWCKLGYEGSQHLTSEQRLNPRRSLYFSDSFSM